MARLENPVVGSFIASWAVCNWPVFVYLTTGNRTAAERVEDINKYLWASKWVWLDPLFISAVFLVFSPFLTLTYSSLTRWVATSIAIRQKEDDEVIDEVTKLKSEFRIGYMYLLDRLRNSRNQLEVLRIEMTAIIDQERPMKPLAQIVLKKIAPIESAMTSTLTEYHSIQTQRSSETTNADAIRSSQHKIVANLHWLNRTRKLGRDLTRFPGKKFWD